MKIFLVLVALLLSSCATTVPQCQDELQKFTASAQLAGYGNGQPFAAAEQDGSWVLGLAFMRLQQGEVKWRAWAISSLTGALSKPDNAAYKPSGQCIANDGQPANMWSGSNE